MDSDEEMLTSPEGRNVPRNVAFNLLSEKSRNIYEEIYKRFMDYCKEKTIVSLSEDVLIAYFAELSKNKKSSTLWSTYSMLKATINVKNNIDIGKYLKLRAFLKHQACGYRAKKSKTLEKEQIMKFLLEAPDEIYLTTKVALLFGVSGACRCDELLKMKIEDIEDIGNKLLITLTNSKTKNLRSFVVTEYLDIFRKYAAHRPVDLNSQRFFYRFSCGKSTRQLIGIHKFGSMPQEIAAYLKLPNSKEYTGHCFRRTSATLLVNSGGNITMLRSHYKWQQKQSSTETDSYVEDSLVKKFNINQEILTNITNKKIDNTVNLDINNTINLYQRLRNEEIVIMQHNSNFTEQQHFNQTTYTDSQQNFNQNTYTGSADVECEIKTENQTEIFITEEETFTPELNGFSDIALDIVKEEVNPFESLSDDVTHYQGGNSVATETSITSDSQTSMNQQHFSNGPTASIETKKTRRRIRLKRQNVEKIKQAYFKTKLSIAKFQLKALKEAHELDMEIKKRKLQYISMELFNNKN